MFIYYNIHLNEHAEEYIVAICEKALKTLISCVKLKLNKTDKYYILYKYHKDTYNMYSHPLIFETEDELMKKYREESNFDEIGLDFKYSIIETNKIKDKINIIEL